MAIAATTAQLGTFTRLNGKFSNLASVAVTGLTAGAANTIPHGLPTTPTVIGLVPGANGLWAQTQAADATNIYLTVGSGGATAGNITVIYGRP